METGHLGICRTRFVGKRVVVRPYAAVVVQPNQIVLIGLHSYFSLVRVQLIFEVETLYDFVILAVGRVELERGAVDAYVEPLEVGVQVASGEEDSSGGVGLEDQLVDVVEVALEPFEQHFQGDEVTHVTIFVIFVYFLSAAIPQHLKSQLNTIATEKLFFLI